MSGVAVHALLSKAGQLAAAGVRPRVRGGQIVLNRDGSIPLHLPNGLVINSLLGGEEWKRLDQRVIRATELRLTGVRRLMELGLTFNVGSLGVLVSQWQTVGEMTEAKVNMTGQHIPDEDRASFNLEGVPIPIIHKEFHFGTRELEAARLGGNDLDTTNGEAAARVVAEKQEDMLFNGHGLTFGGSTIYGYTNHPDRITSAAGGIGGGDWGTITNVVPTMAGALGLAVTNRFYGPFDVYLNPVQYLEASTAYFTDGSGQSPMTRFMNGQDPNNPQVNGFFSSDKVAAGTMVMVQMTSDIVDWAYVEGMNPTTLEWMSGDGMMNFFKVLSVGAPRLKAPQGTGKSGVIVVTGI